MLIWFYPMIYIALINLAEYYFWEYQIFNGPFPLMEDVVSGICQDILHQAMKTFQ